MSDKFISQFFDDKNLYYHLVTFFSWILRRSDFEYIIHKLSEEIGFGDDEVGCYFSNIFDNTDEEGYFEEGVGFYSEHNEGDDLVVDYSMFVKCVELAYSIYKDEYGINDKIEKDIELMHERYSV